MNEKALEKVTGLSRRQIIMLQKTAIRRREDVVIGLSYDYSEEEVKEFLLAKFFKDCGYTYKEIKREMISYKVNKNEVLDKAIFKMESKVNVLEENIQKAKKMKGDK